MQVNRAAVDLGAAGGGAVGGSGPEKRAREEPEPAGNASSPCRRRCGVGNGAGGAVVPSPRVLEAKFGLVCASPCFRASVLTALLLSCLPFPTALLLSGPRTFAVGSISVGALRVSA